MIKNFYDDAELCSDVMCLNGVPFSNTGLTMHQINTSDLNLTVAEIYPIHSISADVDPIPDDANPIDSEAFCNTNNDNPGSSNKYAEVTTNN